MTELIECVPNFSEGVNKEVIAAIANRVRDSSDVRVLGIEPDPDYNRTVLTFAGSPDGVFAGACEVMRASSELIDMREHHGEHPRLGAVDVCPFIPLGDTSMEVCIDLAQRLAEFVGNELNLPAYLYGLSAKKPEHKLLSHIRKGEYEALENRFNNKDELLKSMLNYLNNQNIKNFEVPSYNFNDEKILVEDIDYYYSNTIARASKTMSECRYERANLKKTGTEG